MARRPSRAARAAALLLLVALVPAPALGRSGALALVNVRRDGGHEVVAHAAEALVALVGGWASQPSIAAYLAGRPNPGALPSGDVGRELAALVDRVRASGARSTKELSDLGRLLNVDYLLLLQPRARSVSARLFSVGRGAFAPQGYEAAGADTSRLRRYVLDQTRVPAAPPAGKRRWTKWWIWGAAAVLAGLTIGFSVAARGSDGSGDLRVRVSR